MKTTLNLDNKNETFSNTTGNSYVSEAEIQASAQLTQQLLQNNANAKAVEAETGCHKPLFMVGQKKRDYQKCISDYSKLRNTPAPAPRTEPAPRIVEKTFLGMSQDVGIVVAVLTVGAVLFGAYKIINKNKTK